MTDSSTPDPAERADGWAALSFSDEEAAPWIAAGLLPLHADRWRGWPSSEAVAFALRGLRPAHVREWQLENPGEDLAKWLGDGFALAQATDWIQNGFTLADAILHRSNGAQYARQVPGSSSFQALRDDQD